MGAWKPPQPPPSTEREMKQREARRDDVLDGLVGKTGRAREEKTSLGLPVWEWVNARPPSQSVGTELFILP